MNGSVDIGERHFALAERMMKTWERIGILPEDAMLALIAALSMLIDSQSPHYTEHMENAIAMLAQMPHVNREAPVIAAVLTKVHEVVELRSS